MVVHIFFCWFINVTNDIKCMHLLFYYHKTKGDTIMSQMTIAIIILAATIFCFITEPVPLVVASIAASILYAFTGLIQMSDVFSSYNTDTIVLMIAMMVIGASLFHSGISELIGVKMAKVTGKSEQKAILVTMIASCALSSVCTNIGVMTALAPLCTAMCLSAGTAPS